MNGVFKTIDFVPNCTVWSLRMERSFMIVDGKEMNLSPGMAVTAEVKTGKRRLIEYILSPLKKYAQESVRER